MKKSDWKDLLPEVVACINEPPSEGTLGNAPEDDTRSEAVIFGLQKQNAAEAEDTDETTEGT